jgi:hypothetical protein
VKRPLHAALWHYYCEFDAEGLLAEFHDTAQLAEPGIIRNFLGTRIEPLVYPPLLTDKTGTVEGLPAPGNWHADIAEWAAALYSVAQAQAAGRGVYRIVELGCGWGCWISNMGVAARRVGLKVDLAGVEGDRNHLVNARRVMELNGFAPSDYRLLHGIAGPRPGKAIFPDPSAGNAHWGGEPEFYPQAARLAEATAMAGKGVQVLDVMTLDALGGGGIIDLLHIDIQGAEADYVAGNADAMAKSVRRVLIGTHSRAIEGRLMTHFETAGWRLEMERPAIAPLVGGAPQIRIDGVQMWANPKLTEKR